MEFLRYQLSDISIVSSFSVTPYRAFWHPGSPCFAPLAVRLVFTLQRPDPTLPWYSGSCGGALGRQEPVMPEGLPYYASPVYSIVNDMLVFNAVLIYFTSFVWNPPNVSLCVL